MKKGRVKKSWDSIYQKEGIVQVEPIGAVKWFIDYLQKKKVSSLRLKILDAGCGTGRNIFPFLETSSQSQVVAFDNSPTAIKILKQNLLKSNLLDRVEIKDADLDDKLSEIKGSYDVVIASLVVHHGYIKEIRERIKKLKDRLSVGGYFIYATASTLDQRMPTGVEVEPGTFLNTAQSDGDMPHHYSTPEEIEKMLVGYEVIYKNLATPKMVTGNKDNNAAHWEYVFMKSLDIFSDNY